MRHIDWYGHQRNTGRNGHPDHIDNEIELDRALLQRGISLLPRIEPSKTNPTTPIRIIISVSTRYHHQIPGRSLASDAKARAFSRAFIFTGSSTLRWTRQ